MSTYLVQIDLNSHDHENCFCATCLAKRIDHRVDKKVQKFIPDYLPEAMRNFLHNDSGSRRIFEDHLKRVESQVESTGRQVIDRLVQEDKYKTVNAAFVDDLKRQNAKDMDRLKNENNWLKFGVATTGVLALVALFKK